MSYKKFSKEKKKFEFDRIKKRVLKQYPNARTKVDRFGRYFVVDRSNRRILSDMVLYPNSDDLYQAWEYVDYYINEIKSIELNNKKFSNEKILKDIEKYL